MEGALNKGRSLNSDDTSDPDLGRHPTGALNKGRSLNSGDTGARHDDLCARREDAQQRPEPELRRHPPHNPS